VLFTNYGTATDPFQFTHQLAPTILYPEAVTSFTPGRRLAVERFVAQRRTPGHPCPKIVYAESLTQRDPDHPTFLKTMFQVTLVDSLDATQRQAIELPLAEYNRAQNSAFWIARELPINAARPLTVCARTSNGSAIGGLIGETQFAWLKIALMSVEPSMRLRGVGRRIVETAEAEAIRRGCRYAYVDTMDYQVPKFYERLGYEVAGRIDDWDSHGHAKLFFIKTIA
jgi:GNAT superfamily N-acetyltransferase